MHINEALSLLAGGIHFTNFVNLYKLSVSKRHKKTFTRNCSLLARVVKLENEVSLFCGCSYAD